MTDKNDIDQNEAFKSALTGLSRNGTLMQPDRQDKPICHFREALMDEIMAEDPGLTRAELSKQMAELGF